MFCHTNAVSIHDVKHVVTRNRLRWQVWGSDCQNLIVTARSSLNTLDMQLHIPIVSMQLVGDKPRANDGNRTDSSVDPTLSP
jgi:hypothetical protein